MFQRDRQPEESNNFWISYADLMAGLLFVFILLIGAIVSKSVLMRSNLNDKQKRLAQAQAQLKLREMQLRKSQEELLKLQQNLKEREERIKAGQERISRQQKTIKSQKKHIRVVEEKIRLQKEEVRKLHLLLEDLKMRLKRQKRVDAKLASTIKDLNASLTLHKNELRLRQMELEKLNQLLLARNAKIDELNKKIIILQNLGQDSNVTLAQKQKKLQEYVNRVIVLSSKLTRAKNELRLKDEKLTRLLEALDKQKSRYEELIARLRKQRAKIKSLTGIRLKVIDALKETLGKRIAIDKKSGALRLSSKILFDKGSAKLKDEAKAELKDTFEKYIAALMSNRAIRPYLDRIIIEGHTDSDGGYLYNLELSQKRALAVMNYLLSLPISKKYHLKKYLVASGRAYMDPIIKNGVEDKEASRRIEIKFALRNREQMYEIERILDGKKN